MRVSLISNSPVLGLDRTYTVTWLEFCVLVLWFMCRIGLQSVVAFDSTDTRRLLYPVYWGGECARLFLSLDELRVTISTR